MKKLFLIASCVSVLFLTACNDVKNEKLEEQKEQEQMQKIMGDGVLKMPKRGEPISGLD